MAPSSRPTGTLIGPCASDVQPEAANPAPLRPERADAEAVANDLPRPLGRYALLRLIARGGMGEVYLASTTGLEGAERPVVVKVIRREHAKDPSFLARFLDEARVQAQLQHSGVAQVLEAAMDDRTGEPYVVVEHVEGRSLGDVRARALQIGLRLGWAEAAALATLIAEALGHVHERQDAAGKALAIVHRDLSPQNVMVSYTGDAKLIDFGTARGQNRRCHTVAGVVFAKPGYVAPEVANGDPGDARVDLYALGVMLWELCAGRRFLQGESADHMAAVARDERNPPPLAQVCGAPAALDAIIAKLTAFDRDARYLAARAVACDLAKLLAGAPTLSGGERGVRSRVAEMMLRLFPTEPGRSRREFARLVVAARAHRGALPTPATRAEVAPRASRSATPGETAGPRGAADAATEGERSGPIAMRLPGTRYELCREIGHGGTSVVYEARHVDLGRRVALKVTPPGVTSAPAAERFRREARALSRLIHPGLPGLVDFGVASDGRLFSVLELLEGETLEAHLAREKHVDWREALAHVRAALEALVVVHAAGVVHRDVKPSNLFLVTGGGLKLLDFGLARCAEEAAEEADEASKLGGMTIFGTPEYMAPEQAATGRVDARADLYAVGCVLYEMVTGRLPFARESSVALLDAKIKGSPERPQERAPARAIPDAVDELTMRAIARHPSVRFQTAVEMLAAIDAALEAPVRRRAGRRTLGFVALGASMLLAGALLAGPARLERARASLPSWLGGGRAPSTAVVTAPVEASLEAVATAPSPDDAEEELDADLWLDMTDLEVAQIEAAGAPSDAAAVAVAENEAAAAPADEAAHTPRSARRRSRSDAPATREAVKPTVAKGADAKSADAKGADAKNADAKNADAKSAAPHHSLDANARVSVAAPDPRPRAAAETPVTEASRDDASHVAPDAPRDESARAASAASDDRVTRPAAAGQPLPGRAGEVAGGVAPGGLPALGASAGQVAATEPGDGPTAAPAAPTTPRAGTDRKLAPEKKPGDAAKPRKKRKSRVAAKKK